MKTHKEIRTRLREIYRLREKYTSKEPLGIETPKGKTLQELSEYKKLLEEEQKLLKLLKSTKK
ncbi:MAG: hypothetical protein ABH867_04435 [Patescibacteria group bacterium]